MKGLIQFVVGLLLAPPSLVLVSLLVLPSAKGAKAPYSKKQLEEVATHIVVGKVQAIYSRTEREDRYEYDRKVAEVKVAKVEKGKVDSALVYIRYWSREWKGLGLPPPGGQSYEPQPKKGQTCRFYLAKNAYDGWSKDENQDGGYNVVYVNGVEPIEK